MKKSFILSVFLLFLGLTIQGQDKTASVRGIVKDSLGNVAYATVINLKSKDGTYSNEYGQFIIKAKLGDSLLISTIQHKPRKLRISGEIINGKSLRIYLALNRIELEEVVVPDNDLSGSLSVDAKRRKKTRSEKKKSQMQQMLENAPKSSKFISGYGEKPNERGTADIISKQVDPTRKFQGLGFGIKLGKSRNKKKARVRRLEKEYKLYNQVIQLVGSEFFQQLNITESLTTHFLSKQNKEELKKYIAKNEILDLMEFLTKRSFPYLEKRKSLSKE